MFFTYSSIVYKSCTCLRYNVAKRNKKESSILPITVISMWKCYPTRRYYTTAWHEGYMCQIFHPHGIHGSRTVFILFKDCNLYRLSSLHYTSVIPLHWLLNRLQTDRSLVMRGHDSFVNLEVGWCQSIYSVTEASFSGVMQHYKMQSIIRGQDL